MKNKKFLALVFCLILGMSVPVCAAGEAEGPGAEENVDVSGEASGEAEEMGLLSKPENYVEKEFDPESLPDSYQEEDPSRINGNDVMHYLYNTLRDTFGFNHAAACAVLANASHESNYNYSVLGDGGTSFGILQWHQGRWTALQNWCDANGYDWHNVDGQIAFLKVEMYGSYRDVYDYLLELEDSDTAAFDGAYYMCVHFEKPADTYGQANARGADAMLIFGMDDLRDGYRSEVLSDDSSQGIWALNNY